MRDYIEMMCTGPAFLGPMFTVADWFVMEGAELRYADIFDPYESGPRPPYIHEARFDDLQVFIGEPVTAFDTNRVAEVAVALRTGIPLPVDIVEASLADLRAAAPDGIGIEVFDGDDVEPGAAVWAVRFVDRADIDDGSFAGAMAELLRFARSDQATSL